ncbi:hypothetical protein GF373_03890, partial [bacterium]|nr:hypothetical protein [bacterium]
MSCSFRRVFKILFVIFLACRFSVPVLGEEKRRIPPKMTHFTFTKKGALIVRPPQMRKPGPYYTCLVKMKGVKQFPYDYALFFSTDHGQRGGIWMYVCNGSPTVADNWESYDQALANGKFDYLPKKPAANPIFVDTVQGTQTETPCVNILEGMAY